MAAHWARRQRPGPGLCPLPVGGLRPGPRRGLWPGLQPGFRPGPRQPGPQWPPVLARGLAARGWQAPQCACPAGLRPLPLGRLRPGPQGELRPGPRQGLRPGPQLEPGPQVQAPPRQMPATPARPRGAGGPGATAGGRAPGVALGRGRSLPPPPGPPQALQPVRRAVRSRLGATCRCAGRGAHLPDILRVLHAPSFIAELRTAGRLRACRRFGGHGRPPPAPHLCEFRCRFRRPLPRTKAWHIDASARTLDSQQMVDGAHTPGAAAG